VVKPGQRWLAAAAAGTLNRLTTVHCAGQAWPTAADPGRLTVVHTGYQQVYSQGHRPDDHVLVQTYTCSYDKVEGVTPIKMLRTRQTVS
jgi:hypothetical protein